MRRLWEGCENRTERGPWERHSGVPGYNAQHGPRRQANRGRARRTVEGRSRARNGAGPRTTPSGAIQNVDPATPSCPPATAPQAIAICIIDFVKFIEVASTFMEQPKSASFTVPSLESRQFSPLEN